MPSVDTADARVGHPLTPMGVAGVNRRSLRRRGGGCSRLRLLMAAGCVGIILIPCATRRNERESAVRTAALFVLAERRPYRPGRQVSHNPSKSRVQQDTRGGAYTGESTDHQGPHPPKSMKRFRLKILAIESPFTAVGKQIFDLNQTRAKQ